MKKAVDPSFQWIDPTTGKPTQYFAELIQNLSANGLSMPVSKTAPTNGQVPIFNSITGQYEPGAN